MVVYFELILPKKLHHGRLLLRLSGKAVVMVFCATDIVAQNFQNSCFEKNSWWRTFLILANKALYGDSFPVISTIFQNSYFKQHLRTTASERFFVLRVQSPENVTKAALKNLRKLSRQRPQEYIIFNIQLIKLLHPDDFPEICEMFQTATF